MTDSYSPEELENRIAIVGMACRVPGANSVASFWENVKSGKDALTRLSADELRAAGVSKSLVDNPAYVRAGMFMDDTRGFDANFFGFSPRDARILDPQHRHFLEICWEALEDGGYDPRQYPGSIGVFAGSGHNSYMPYNLLSNPDLVEEIGFFLMRHTGNDKDFLATRVSYNFNLRGPSLSIQTACSTSLVCVHTAAQSLISGECDMALAGGITISLPEKQGYLHEEGGITSSDGHCRAFDSEATGTIISSGAGVVLLKRLEDAIEDRDHIHGVIIGSAVNNDGSSKVNYLAPSVDGQAAAISEAIEVAGIDPESVTFVECHGTGTKIGDPIEVAALTQAYGHGNDKKGYCAIGSVKSNIGHTDTAAGVLGLIKAVMSVKTATLTPTAHYRNPNPAIDFDNSPFFVNDSLRAWQADGPRRASVNSLGVGGTNAHVIIEQGPEMQSESAKPWNILALSAKSKTALTASMQRLRHSFEQDPEQNLSDCEFTLLHGRQAMRQRCFAVVRDVPDALAVLADPDSDRWGQATESERPGGVVFMYAGGGAQHPGMGRDLYETQPVFRESLEKCARILKNYADFDLLELMYPDPANFEASAAEMERPSRSLPCLFAMQYAQSMLWLSMGVEPEALIGHSMGENTALCVAGGITLEEGLSLVAKRGKLQEQAPEGGMVSVFAKPDDLQKFLTDNLSISVFNGPELCVVSGPVDELAILQDKLDRDDIQNQRVRINVAAHSKLLEPVLAEFKAHLETFSFKTPTIPIASTLSGEWLTDEQATSVDYWVDQLRRPVRFDDAVKLLLESDADRNFLEVGPGNILSSLVRQQPLASDREVITSSPHRNDTTNDHAFMLTSLARLWACDGKVDWKRYAGKHDSARVSLPTYPFEHREYWVEAGQNLSGTIGTTDERTPFDQWFYQPSWKSAPAPALPQELLGAGVLVLGNSSAASLLASRLTALGCSVATHNLHDACVSLRDAIEDAAKRHSDGLVVVHACGLEPLSLDLAGLDASFYSLWETVSALSECDLEGVRLAVVSNGALRTVPGEELPGSMAATMLGLLRVASKEFPSISVRFIDTDLGAPQPEGRIAATVQMVAADIVENIDGEFRAAAWTRLPDYEKCRVVSYRQGQRFEETFSRISSDAFGTSRLESLTGKHFVISGGLGGLGLDAAKYLAGQGCSHVSLIARSRLPSRDDWPSHHGADTRIARRIAAVEALEASGIGVSIFVADVTDVNALRKVRDAARTAGGPISGILHTAGTLDDRLIQLKNRKDAEAVINPKVVGAINLVDVFKDEPLESVVFYSSVSAYLGAAGQADYAAANAFLDAYANDLSSRGMPAVSINWPIWQDVGMAADLAAGRKTAGSGFASFEPRSRGASYEVCLSTGDWMLNEHRARNGLAIVPGTAIVQLVHSAVASRAECSSGKCITIRNMAIYAPITVTDGDQIVAAVRFGGEANREFEIFTALSPAAVAASDWSGEHVQGQVAVEDAPTPVVRDLEAIRQKLEQQSDLVGTGLASPFMNFGGRWDCLQDYWSTDQEMFAELELPERYADDLSRHLLHPALLDNAVAGLQSIIFHRDNPGKFLIPMSYERIEIHSPLPRRVFSHVVEVASGIDDQKHFDVDVFDAAGRLLVAVRRFAMKVGDANTLEAEDSTDTAGVDLDFSGGISTEEGHAALGRLAGNPIYAQVVVSPVDFKSVLRKGSRVQQAGIAEAVESDEVKLSSEFAAPETEFEKKLTEIWKKGLGLKRIGVHDNFFELGGHSLLLTQLVFRMKKDLKVNPKTSLLFGSPTISAWSKIAESAGAETDGASEAPKPIKRLSRDRYRASGQTEPTPNLVIEKSDSYV